MGIWKVKLVALPENIIDKNTILPMYILCIMHAIDTVL